MIQKGMELQDKLLYIRMRHWNDINIEKTRWVESVSDHRLNSALLPLMALSSYDPSIRGLVINIVESVEKERRKLKAQSDDGVIVNVLWEKISENLWGVHNGLYYVGGEKETEGNSEDDYDEDSPAVVKPLAVSNLAETLKISTKTLRKILTSLNITPENTPGRVRIGKHTYRPIFFNSLKLEKRLKEFVVDYEKGKLNEICVPDVPHVPSQKPIPPPLTDSGSSEKSVSDREKGVPDGTTGTSGTKPMAESVDDELTQKLCQELSPDRGYNLDRVRSILLREGLSERAAEKKILDLEVAQIIRFDDVKNVFLAKVKTSGNGFENKRE